MSAYPTPKDPAASHRMRRNPSRDTGPEVRLRSALHRRGLRFRKDRVIALPDRRVRPDLVFPRSRVAVFVDGCYWHGCPEHGSQPAHNADYWAAKFDRNARRDRAVDEALSTAGWRVVRLWEHVPTEEAAQRVAAALEAPSVAPN